MPDEIIEELWRIKDDMAREHGNDVRKLATYLQGKQPRGGSVFKTTADVAAYVKEEKEAWGR